MASSNTGKRTLFSHSFNILHGFGTSRQSNAANTLTSRLKRRWGNFSLSLEARASLIVAALTGVNESLKASTRKSGGKSGNGSSNIAASVGKAILTGRKPHAMYPKERILPSTWRVAESKQADTTGTRLALPSDMRAPKR